MKRKPFLKGKNETIDKAFAFVKINDFIGFSMFVNGKLKIKRVFSEIQVMKNDLLGDVFGKSLIAKYILDLTSNEVISIKANCKVVPAEWLDVEVA